MFDNSVNEELIVIVRLIYDTRINTCDDSNYGWYCGNGASSGRRHKLSNPPPPILKK